MRLRLSTVSYLAYALPALLATALLPKLGYVFSEEGSFAIFASIAAGCLGLLSAGLIVGRTRRLDLPRWNRTDHSLSIFLMLAGLAAIAANFAIVGQIPLISSGSGRIELQETYLWNVYVIGSLGLLMYSRVTIGQRHGRFGKFLVSTYIISAIMTAWKGTFILFLVAYLCPRLRHQSVRFDHLIVGATSGFFLLVLINLLRAEASLTEVLAQPVYYLTWGFVNFDTEAIGHSSSCLYTVPLLGCQFAVDNRYLLNSTWNVLTALSPIYIDGGIVYIFIFFFFIGALVRVTENLRSSLLIDYLYFVSCYFLLLAHNGYAFYSRSFFLAAGVIILLNALRAASSGARELKRGAL